VQKSKIKNNFFPPEQVSIRQLTDRNVSFIRKGYEFIEPFGLGEGMLRSKSEICSGEDKH